MLSVLSLQQSTEHPNATLQSQGSAADPARLDRPAFKAYLDFRFVKSNLDLLRKNVQNRNSSADPEAVAELYDDWVRLLEELESVRAERNATAKAMKLSAVPGV